MLRKVQALLVVGISVVATPSAAQDPTDDSVAPAAPAEGEAASAAPAATPVDEGKDAGTAEVTSLPDAATAGRPGKDAEGTARTDPKESTPAKSSWEAGFSGYFRAPMALGFSNRPGPDNKTGKPELQISYGPNRTVDANYYSFAYTRLQEQDWVELFFHAKKKHVQATVGWMGYWYQSAGFRNPDAAWVPSIAYLTIDTDFEVAGLKPNIALSGGAWWPKFGRFDKYDTYTLGQFRQLGEQLKLTIPFSEDFTTTLVHGFGTGRDGTFQITAPPPYQGNVSLNLIHHAHLQFNYKKFVEVGLHHNAQWTRDPKLSDGASGDKAYANARGASLTTIGGELKLAAPVAGSLWLSPSVVNIKNGWALGEAGVEVVHGLSPEGVAANYLGWSGSTLDSLATGKLVNFGFLYENSLATILDKPRGTTPDVTLSVFGLLVDASVELPATSKIQQDRLTQFKWGADVEYNPLEWTGLMLRFDSVNSDMDNPGYIFSAITSRVSFYSNFLSGERVYLQYSRYRYGDNMTIAGVRPWGLPIVPGSDLIQGGVYTGSKPDMDVLKLQAEVSF